MIQGMLMACRYQIAKIPRWEGNTFYRCVESITTTTTTTLVKGLNVDFFSPHYFPYSVLAPPLNIMDFLINFVLVNSGYFLQLLQIYIYKISSKFLEWLFQGFFFSCCGFEFMESCLKSCLQPVTKARTQLKSSSIKSWLRAGMTVNFVQVGQQDSLSLG